MEEQGEVSGLDIGSTSDERVIDAARTEHKRYLAQNDKRKVRRIERQRSLRSSGSSDCLIFLRYGSTSD